MSLPSLAIRRPVTTAMFFLGVGLLGLVSLERLQVELMPEVVYPEIFIGLNLQGTSPEQVERDLVVPVEGEGAALGAAIHAAWIFTRSKGSEVPLGELCDRFVKLDTGRRVRPRPELEEQYRKLRELFSGLSSRVRGVSTEPDPFALRSDLRDK